MDTGDIGEFQVLATFHSGRYGPENYKGDVISTMIKCNESQDVISINKEIIFVVDCSSSMYDSITSLKGGLLAFRDIIIDRNPSDDMRCSYEIEKDFKSLCNTKLIIYNDDPQEIYSSNEEYGDWGHSVESIHTKGMTNIGDAIKLAYSKTNPNKCTWIVLMTDGLPNKGKYQTKSSFQLLKNSKPKNTRLITLGYGKEYNSKILTSLGEFTAVESMEYIPSVFGSIANEFKYSWAFGAKWKMEKKIPGSKYIVGSSNIGCIYYQREYTMGILLGKTPENLENIKMELSFTSVLNMYQVSIPISVVMVDYPLSEYFREKYYYSAKGRRMFRLYNVSHGSNIDPNAIIKECKIIKKELEEWTEDCALLHKEELLKMIEEFDNLCNSGSTMHKDYDSIRYEAVSRYTDAKRQNSNIITSEMTRSQREMVRESYNSYLAYTMDDSD